MSFAYVNDDTDNAIALGYQFNNGYHMKGAFKFSKRGTKKRRKSIEHTKYAPYLCFLQSSTQQAMGVMF